MGWFDSLFGKNECSISPGTDALEGAILLVLDVTKGSALSIAGLAHPVLLLVAYGPIIPDLVKLIPEIGDIPCEVSALTMADLDRLVATVVMHYGLSQSAAVGAIRGALQVISWICDAPIEPKDLVKLLEKS